MATTRFGRKTWVMVWLPACLMMGGCSTIIGLEGYVTRAETVDGGHDLTSVDASTDGLAQTAGDGSAGCNADLTTNCYPCAPTEGPQFLNACTNATCVPFDDGTRLLNLLPEGGLPPLPSGDAGSN